MTFEGWGYFVESWKIKEVDEMVLAHPVYPVKFFLVAGVLLINLQALTMFIATTISMIKGKDDES